MSTTKHKIFKIPLSEDGKYTLDENIQKSIDTFLVDPNNIYINHSISILSEVIVKYGDPKTINKFVLVSLIYKDLKGTSLDLTKASKKVKIVVSKEIEKGTMIEEPQISTSFEQEIAKLPKTKINDPIFN